MANLNDKLISYGNLAEFHSNLLNDSSVSNKATWSSQKISAMIADAGFAVEIVAELPATGDPHTIYFVPSSNPETSNVKDEFMYVNGAWEQVGSTAIDLTPYATKSELNAGLATKQNTLTAGQNISIDASNNISVDGYVFDSSNYSFATKYRDGEDPTIINTNIATGNGSHAEGNQTTASGQSSHAEGEVTVASGDYGSHAEGTSTQANGSASHAEGNQTVATGNYSHAEGGATQATGNGSHAEGSKSIASGKNSHAEGGAIKNQSPTTAAGSGSHAEGNSTLASSQSSHAEGELTEAKNGAEHALGQCNVSHTDSTQTMETGGKTIHSIGIGLVLNNVPQRKNATEVMYNGDHYILGIGNYDGVHIKGEQGAPANTQTLQEVVNGKADKSYVDASLVLKADKSYVDTSLALKADKSYVDASLALKADVYEVATLADILALFAEPVPPTPPTQPNDEIWYTTTNNSPIYIDIDPEEAEDYFDKPILSNTYSDGKGIIKFDGNLTHIKQSFDLFTDDYDKLTSVQIPDSVTILAYYLFSNCDALVSVKLPSNINGIGTSAFYGCSSLESIEIPERAAWIGGEAFSYCTSLTSINIPNSVTEIGDSAFAGCTGLTSVTIPNSVTNIGNNAFDGCTNLTSVIIGNSVTEIGYAAFSGCTSLTSVTCEATTPPTLTGGEEFDDTNNCPIYVPAESVNAYKSSWSDYASRIQAIQ